MPRLIQMADFRMEAYLDGNLLVITHRDVPGIIGSIGQVLAKARVNIAQMTVGREGTGPGGTSIGVLNLDSPAPNEAIEAIAQHPNVESAAMLELPQSDDLPAWLRM